MKRNVLKKLFLVSICIIALVGCENKNKSEGMGQAGKENENESSKTETISMMGWYDEDDMEGVLQAINKELSEEYNFEYQYVAQTNYDNVLSTQLAAGGGPDIIFDGANFPARIKAGNLLEITEQNYIKDFNESGYALCKEEDKIFGIPSYGWFSGLWYNKDIFEENEIINIPETFDELIAICDKLSDNGVQPLGFGLADGDTALHSLLGFLENDFYHNNGPGIEFDTAFAKGEKVMSDNLNDYVERWYTLIDKGYINELMVGISNEQALADFIAGKTAMFNGGPWQYTNFQDAEMNFGMIPHLGTTKGNNYMIGGPGGNFGINKNTKNIEGAKKALEAISSINVQQAFTDANVGGFSYRNGVEGEMPDEYSAVINIINSGNIACSWDRWNVNMPSQALYDEIVSQIQGLVTKYITIEQFLQEVDKKAASIRYNN